MSFAVIAHFKSDAEDGVGTIYFGNCDTVRRWNTALHLLINVLATALLAASSYTMQCLNSPSRTEIDIAHREGTSMDVGILSVKNFKQMRLWKTVLWLLLSLSTVPLHLLWNSTIIITSTSNTFNYVIANELFLTGANYAIPLSYVDGLNACNEPSEDLATVVTNIYDGFQAGNFTSITAEQCFNHYIHGDDTANGNLILITEAETTMQMSGCGYSWRMWNGSAIMGVDSGLTTSGLPLFMSKNLRLTSFPKDTWYYDPLRSGIFFSNSTSGLTEHPSLTESQIVATMRDQMKQPEMHGTWNLGDYHIKRCVIATDGAQRCQLQYVSYILYLVVVCNLVKLACMFAAANFLWDLNDPILATIGDAAASFLAHGDAATAGCCLLDFKDLENRSCSMVDRRKDKYIRTDLTTISNKRSVTSPSRSKRKSQRHDISVYWRPPSARLMSATSQRRWGLTMFICWIYVVAGFLFWIFSVASGKFAAGEAMSSKFGTVSPYMLLGIDGASGSRLLLNIILANSFQLALSTTYYLYNGLYTAQCAALEWAAFVKGTLKPLRVTYPRGQQRSTYYLQLPWKYAIPLTVMLGVMHFLVSECIFLARLVYYGPDGQPRSDMGYMSVGYSPPAVLTTSCVGLVIFLAQIFNACRTLDNRIPLHGNKSMVISAMCHVEEDEGESHDDQPIYPQEREVESDISTRPLMWGVTRKPRKAVLATAEAGLLDEDSAGHCSFSAEIVDKPRLDLRYL